MSNATSEENRKATFRAFVRCVEEAPAGCHEQARELRTLIGDHFDAFNAALREAGYEIDQCDTAWWLEAAMYEYVRRCNPDESGLLVAEAFGKHMDGPERARVLANLARDSESLRQLGVRK